MATPEEIIAVVHEVLGSAGDETILDYIVGVLEDEHYDHGVDGGETYEHLGPILVRNTKRSSVPKQLRIGVIYIIQIVIIVLNSNRGDSAMANTNQSGTQVLPATSLHGW